MKVLNWWTTYPLKMESGLGNNLPRAAWLRLTALTWNLVKVNSKSSKASCLAARLHLSSLLQWKSHSWVLSQGVNQKPEDLVTVWQALAMVCCSRIGRTKSSKSKRCVQTPKWRRFPTLKTKRSVRSYRMQVKSTSIVLWMWTLT